MISKKIKIADVPEIKVSGKFDQDSYIVCPAELLQKLRGGKAVLRIDNMGNGGIPYVELDVGGFDGMIRILAGSSGRLKIGNCGRVNIDARIGRDSSLSIGDRFTCNQAMIVAVGASIDIGEDCMLSDGILIQGGDQHGIIDLDSMRIVNDKNSVRIRDHVWLGRNSAIMPGSVIESGSIIAACSVVTGSVPAFSLVAGVPARVLKGNVSWCRPVNRIDQDTKAFLSKAGYLN